FSMAGDLYLFDPETGFSKNISPYDDMPLSEKQQFADPKKFLENFDISSNGDMISLTVRGQVFCSGENGAPIIKLGGEIRKKNACFVTDTDLAYVFDDGMKESLRIRNAADDKEKTVEYEFGQIYGIYPSPDGRKIAVTDDKFVLYEVDSADLKVKIIDRSEEGVIRNVSWSPNSDLLAYSYPMKIHTLGGYSSMHIRVFSFKAEKIYRMTSEGYNDFSPVFDPDGKYLYYLSNRSLDPVQDKISFNFSFPIITRPHVIRLYPGEKLPYDKIPAAMEPPSEREMNLETAYMRSDLLPIDAADYRSMQAMKNGIFILKIPVHGEFSIYYGTGYETGTLQFFDFSTSKLKDAKTDITSFLISRDGKKIVYTKKEGTLFYAAVNAEKTGENEEEFDFQRIKVPIEKNAEFRQMFSEAWRLAVNNYWKEEYAKSISENVFKKYSQLVERARTRYDLSDIIREMQGEFRTSHSYEMGGDFTDVQGYPIGKLGIDIIPENGKQIIKKIYTGDFSNENEKSPLLLAFPEISEGDAIVSVNGKQMDGKSNVYRELLNHSGDLIQMKIERKNGNIMVGYVKTLGDDTYLRYRSWVEGNRRYVHEKSGKRIGYLHIPDMGMMGLNEFYRLYTSESSYDGLIVDVRYNGGGFVSQLILEKLSNRRLGYDVPRRGSPSPYPQDSVNGPIVSITNEYAGSDGDVYSHVFKMLKIRKLIGTRTWGGVVGINPVNRLIDGTVVTQP
ncbi:MAG: S41 family peptidase, partial [Thermoplasmata archaeon]